MENIGLVILDVMMPEMNGENCFRAVRKMNPNAKIFLITGFTNDDSSYASLRDEAAGIIEKPFDLYKLTNDVKTVLDGRD